MVEWRIVDGPQLPEAPIYPNSIWTSSTVEVQKGRGASMSVEASIRAYASMYIVRPSCRSKTDVLMAYGLAHGPKTSAFKGLLARLRV